MVSVSDILMHEPPSMTGACAVYAYDKKLDEKFRGYSRFGDPIVMGRKRGDFLDLPRAVCPLGLDLRVDGEEIDFTSSWKPRDDKQANWVADSLEFLQDGKSGISQAGTGFGKTACSMPVIAGIGRKTLVIVNKEDLLKQWLEAPQQFLGLKPREIGLIRQNVCQVENRKIVVGMLHSLSKPDRYPQWILDEFGLVIWDECHHVPADTFAYTAGLFPAKLRWGLSATPERTDGKEIILFAHIGPIRVRAEDAPLTPRVLQVVTGWKCPMVKVRDPDTGEVVLDELTGKPRLKKLPHSPGRCGHITKIISNNADRNARLAMLTKACYDKSRRTVFFSDSLDHLDTMHQLLATQLPTKDVGYYVGGMKERELDHSKGCRIILATYGMMAEGTNIPWLDTCVLGTPRGDVRQTVGRILRVYEGKQPPLVIDPVDDDSPVYAGYAKKRRAWYRKIGADVQTVT